VGHEHTDENLVNPLTKGLAREKVQNTSMKMGLAYGITHDGNPT